MLVGFGPKHYKLGSKKGNRGSVKWKEEGCGWTEGERLVLSLREEAEGEAAQGPCKLHP